MTRDELLALIRQKIDGQGCQVDIGGALGDILRGLVDLIPSGGGYTFAAPLKLSGTDVSLEYGSGLEKDDNMLAVKVNPAGGLISDGDGLSVKPLLLVPHSLSLFTDFNKEAAAQRLNITTSELDALFDGKYPTIRFKTSAGSGAYFTLIPMRDDINDGDIQRIFFYSVDGAEGMVAIMSLFCEDGSYSFSEI